jgi:hypothetical protein
MTGGINFINECECLLLEYYAKNSLKIAGPILNNLLVQFVQKELVQFSVL